MTEKAISPLRRRLIEDMAVRRLGPKTQYHYIRHIKRFADFVGRSADKATAEDVHRYQVWLASIGTPVPRERGRELIGDHRPYCDCPRHLIETTARPSPRSRDTGAAP
jgi:Phage integrase, N-terminal SAM-like domain